MFDNFHLIASLLKTTNRIPLGVSCYCLQGRAQMPWPAFPKSLESVPNLVSDFISHICHCSLYLLANHTSPFLSKYAMCSSVASQSLVITEMLFPFHQSHCPSFAAEPVFREAGDTLKRASGKAATEVFPPLLSDHCCQRPQIPEPSKNKDQMR